jgi:hypothetical protein
VTARRPAAVAVATLWHVIAGRSLAQTPINQHTVTAIIGAHRHELLPRPARLQRTVSPAPSLPRLAPVAERIPK